MTGTDQMFMTRTAQVFMKLVREGKLEEHHRDDFREVYEPNARIDPNMSAETIDTLASVARITSGKPSTAAAAMAWPERLMTLARDYPAPAPSGDEPTLDHGMSVSEIASACRPPSTSIALPGPQHLALRRESRHERWPSE